MVEFEKLKIAAQAFRAADAAPSRTIISPGFFTSFALAVGDRIRDLRNATGLQLSDAEKCVKNSFDATEKLADETGEPSELRRYTRTLIALTNELTAIKEEKLRRNEGAYAPLTESIKRATDDLKKTKEDADRLAQALNIGADLLSGFGKLLGALGVS
jgi:transcriptional regulator with XRE-family HTH domain